MTYGEAKTRDMCRSILPSTRRKTDRRNAQSIKRRNRRLTRQTLHDWKMTADLDDFEGHIFGYEDSLPASTAGAPTLARATSSLPCGTAVTTTSSLR